MAKKTARKLRPEDIGNLPQEQLDSVQTLMKNVEENWKQIAGGAGLVVVCLLAYSVFQVNHKMTEREANSLYAQAVLETKDADKKIALLEEAEAKGSSLQLELLYSLGEESIYAGKHDKAKEVMTKILSEHADSEFASRAADALAFLKENDGDFEGAIKDYENLKSKWPKTLEAERVPYRVGKLQEKLKNIEAAVKAYQEQMELFPESTVADDSKAALEKIKFLHPELFPDDEEVKELAALEAPIEAAAATPEAAPATDAAAPAEATPADAAPATETPAATDAAPATTEAPTVDSAAPATEAPSATDAAPAPAEAPAAAATETPAAQ